MLKTPAMAPITNPPIRKTIAPPPLSEFPSDRKLRSSFYFSNRNSVWFVNFSEWLDNNSYRFVIYCPLCSFFPTMVFKVAICYKWNGIFLFLFWCFWPYLSSYYSWWSFPSIIKSTSSPVSASTIESISIAVSESPSWFSYFFLFFWANSSRS